MNLKSAGGIVLSIIAIHLQESQSFSVPSSSQSQSSPVSQSRRLAISTLSTTLLPIILPNIAAASPTKDSPATKTTFRRYPQIRFIAALGDPKASSGTGADTWGLWRDDPGPRGTYLRDYEKRIAANNNVAPAGWAFDPQDWWVEEHGLIMSTPGPLPRKRFDKDSGLVIPEKRYLVTGAREVTTALTVREDGSWELQEGTLYDVTHLPCRSARYTGGDTCSPKNANLKDFPVKPGAEMPAISGCDKQDYAVLFVLGEEI